MPDPTSRPGVFATLMRNRVFLGLLSLVVVLLALGTVVYWITEDLSLFDSLYLSVITLTTIGYGEPSPQTVVGRSFTIAYALVGIGLIVAFAGQIAEAIIEGRIERRARED